MSKGIVVTNLRVPSEEWNQLKAVAAEQGMSANEYINFLMRNVISPITSWKKKAGGIWDVPELAKKAKKMDELSRDDKIIYE